MKPTIYLSKELLKKLKLKKPSKKQLKYMDNFAKMKIKAKQDRRDGKKLCKIFKKFKRDKFNHNQSKKLTLPYVSKETALAMVLDYMSMRMGMQGDGDIIKEITKNKKIFNAEVGAFVHGRGHSTNYAHLLNATNKQINEAIKIVNKYF